MEILVQVLTVFVGSLFILWLVYRLAYSIVEPIYITVFKRPIYLYCYPFPKKLNVEQHRILRREVPFYKTLSARKKTYFEHRTAEFISCYQFHGKDGYQITDETRILIGATYIMLTFGMRQYKTNVFDKIIVYPDAYFSTINQDFHHGEFNPLYRAVVFSWKHFMEGYASGNDNLNLGIHEFSHALHYHGLKKRDTSAMIFADMYSKIMKEVKHPPNAKRLVDSEYFRIYAYTNEFEFLAVILEHFFETPERFKIEFPELYHKVKLMINYREN